METGLYSSENQIISHHPYCPTHSDYNLHAKLNMELISEGGNCSKSIQIMGLKTQGSPTHLSKRASQEQVHSRFLNSQVYA